MADQQDYQSYDQPDISDLAALLSGYSAGGPAATGAPGAAPAPYMPPAPAGPPPPNPVMAPAMPMPAGPGPATLASVTGNGFGATPPRAVVPDPNMGAMGVAVPQAPNLMQPDLSTGKALLDKLRADANPTDPNQYKPKWWERLMGGATGFAIGFGGGQNGAEVGGHLTTRRYDQAESQRQKRLEGDKTAFEAFNNNEALKEKGNTYQRQTFEDSLRRTDEFGKQVNEKRQAERDAALDEHQQRRDKISDDNESRKEKKDAADTDYRKQQDAIRNRQVNRQIANDSEKVRHDKATEDVADRKATVQELHQQMQEAAQNNKVPKLAPGTFKDRDAVDMASETWYTKQRERVDAEKMKASTLMGKDAKESERQKKFDDIEKSYTERAKQFEAEKKNWYADVDSRSKANPAPKQGANPSSNPAPANDNGDMVRVQKPDGNIVRIPRANVPQAQKLGGKVIG